MKPIACKKCKRVLVEETQPSCFIECGCGVIYIYSSETKKLKKRKLKKLDKSGSTLDVKTASGGSSEQHRLR